MKKMKTNFGTESKIHSVLLCRTKAKRSFPPKIALLAIGCSFVIFTLTACANTADHTPSQANTSAPSDSQQISDIAVTYKNADGGRVEINGYTSSALTWQPPQELGQQILPGQLYFANPAFLGTYFQDKEIEGSACWYSDSKSLITVSFTQNSDDNDSGAIAGPTIVFTANVEESSLCSQESSSGGFEGESIDLSEEELIQIGVALANIIQDVESYCAQN